MILIKSEAKRSKNMININFKEYSRKAKNLVEPEINPAQAKQLEVQQVKLLGQGSLDLIENSNDSSYRANLKEIYENIIKDIGTMIYDGDKFYINKITHYEAVTLHELRKHIKNYLFNKYPKNFHPNTVDALERFFELEFIMPADSFNNGNYLNFKDGYLDLHKNELLEHNSEVLFTYVQPFNYKESSNKEPVAILKFLNSCVSGDQNNFELLQALTYCILLNLTQYEVFLEIVGSGSTGKSTYINLLRALINPAQATATSMKELEGNRFESMNLQGKKLIYISDSEAYRGSSGKLKSLVSGDSIRAEKKFKDITHFSVKAIFVFAGNYSITSTDHTSGMIRRRILINFNNISKQRVKLLEIHDNKYYGELANEIPMFINYLLNNREKYIEIMQNINNSAAQNENYIFNFFKECLLIDENGKVHMGNNAKPFVYSNPYLYPLFIKYCKAIKVKVIPLHKFIELFLDWARVNNINLEKNRDKSGFFYSGVTFNNDVISTYVR
jgi:P4 family phage/plasmid primase-like protien